MDVAVVGCGVIGLTAAIRLHEAGHRVRVIGKDPPSATTSARAGAVWTTTEVEPIERSFAWALASRAVFEDLSRTSDSGVFPLEITELFTSQPQDRRWLETPFVREEPAAAIPPGYHSAWRIQGFRIQPRRHLDWLAATLTRMGIELEIEQDGLGALHEAPGDVVVNASGLGAKVLVGDPGVHPIRGQMVAVANPGLDRGVSDECDPARIAYLYPQGEEVLLGGCRQVGNWSTEEDTGETRRILEDVSRLEPRLTGAAVRRVVVGLRPGRHEVRLERDVLADGRPVIHDYGHAGSGFTLSWGCAAEVAELTSR